MGNELEGSSVPRETSGPRQIAEGIEQLQQILTPRAARADLKAQRADNFAVAVEIHADAWLDRWLKRAGVSDRERTADALRVPAVLARAIKEQAAAQYEAMTAGDLPRAGFGISGGVGIGKTFAIVALFRAMARARWMRDPSREVVEERWLAWRRWSEVAAEMRVTAAGYEHGYAEAERAMHKLVYVDALVLDDLGGERMRGEYEDDWVTSMLDLLIDRRYNAMKPTWYTTNLSRADFIERYGARMFSRLCGENTLITVPVGPDLRIVDARTR